MDQTQFVSQVDPSTPDPHHGIVAIIFRSTAPLNLSLSVYILIQNTAIICHYYSDRRRLSSMLVILIAAVDVLNAVTEFARGSMSLLCMRDADNTMRIASWIPASYVGFGVLCNCMSIFFYTVLSVVKTINIVNPFYRINDRLVKIALVFVSLLGLAVTITDVIYFNYMGDSIGDCSYTHWSMILTYSFVGEMIMIPTLSDIDVTLSVQFGLLAVPHFLEYIFPCILVFFCTIIQMFVIWKALRNSANVLENEARHANITILLITMLFLICNGTLAITSVIYVYYLLSGYGRYHSTTILCIRMISQYTLPLINAAIFPIIIIFRNAGLRETYKGYIVFVISGPARVYGLLRHHRLDGRNEQEIPYDQQGCIQQTTSGSYEGSGTEDATSWPHTPAPGSSSQPPVTLEACSRGEE